MADYLADTGKLSTEQHGAYLLILMDYWRNGAPNDDDAELANIARMSINAWSIARAKLEQYFSITEGKWLHKRVEQEMVNAASNKHSAHARAIKGSDARWNKNKDASSNASSNAQVMLASCPSPSPSPIQEIDKPKRSRSATCTIQTFLETCQQEGIERIPKDDPIFEFAQNTGIPIEMVRVTWQQFVRNNKETGKRQKDWRAAFRNCVRGNWFKFWYIEADGTVKETSQYRAMKKDLGDNHVQ